MNYYAITVLTTTAGSELIADIFFQLGGQGVTIYDSADIHELFMNKKVWDYIDDKLLIEDEVVRVIGYTTEQTLKDTLKSLNLRLEKLSLNSDLELGSLEVTTKKINGADWQNEWKKHYSPIELDKIIVIPQWFNYYSQKINVRINPGMAFGTGEHESTRMCLQILQDLDLHGKHVLDIGCGSGILGIAALKLGAKSCYFSDIDCAALKNARENILLNEVEKDSVVELASLSEGRLIGKGQVLLANITADMLILLSKNIKKYLADGARVILSGIIREKEREVHECYLEKGFAFKSRLAQNDWVMLQFSYGS